MSHHSPIPTTQGLRARLRVQRARLSAAWRVGRNVADFASPLAVAARSRFAPRLRVLCYPGWPSRYQVLYKLCAVNGYEIVASPRRPYDVGVHFTGGGCCNLPEHPPVLNRHCTDISKTHVGEVFERAFGYALAIDPTTYAGRIVEKSDANYKHDGRILEGPITAGELREGRVYQRLVETVADGLATDLRTPIYAGQVPLVYEKRRPAEARFNDKNPIVNVRETTDVYSADELAALSRFAEGMGLDYGELDVLRDKADGRIYVVDVANTPAGPSHGFTKPVARAAVARLAGEFAQLVQQTLEAGTAKSRRAPAAAVPPALAGWLQQSDLLVGVSATAAVV